MRIKRLDLSARVLHWSHAIIFIWLLITGIHIFTTPKSLLGDPLIRMMHLYASLPFVVLPAIIYIAGSSSARNDVKDLSMWTADDLKWFGDFLTGKKTSAAGKFNGGQKASFTAMLLLVTGLSLSGFGVWMKSMFSLEFVEMIFLIHDFLAVLAVLVFTGHILFALYYSELIRSIIYGAVDEKWAEEHYPVWFKQKKIKRPSSFQ